MRSRSPSIGSISSDGDELEISKFDDILVTPNPRLGNTSQYPPLADDYEDDEDEPRDDDGVMALLGSHSHHAQELTPHGTVWNDLKYIVFESAPTLVFATLGAILTGKLLSTVSRWKTMRAVDELIMIIPIVLNLKGNLEMNLSARMSTAANVGDLDDPTSRRQMILGNLSLLQVQAAVVSFVAACFSLFLGKVIPLIIATPEADPVPIMMFARRPTPSIPSGGKRISELAEFTVVASTAMSSACLSSILLGSFMCGFILLCRHFGLDPDNIAPPVASALGDLVTLTLFALVSAILVVFVKTWLPFIAIAIVLVSAIICGFSARRNPFVKDLLTQGWSPLFGAMILSSGAGLVLDHFATRFKGFSLLAMGCSSLPGGVGAIFVSRLSTALHAQSLLPSSEHGHKGQHEGPSPNLVMMTLILVALPLEVGLLTVLQTLGWLRVPIVFAMFSVIFFCTTVSISLIVGRILTNFLWKKNLDPDMYALPIHSAFVDLVGQSLLVLCFEVVALLGAPLPKIPK